jgi:acetyltransferase
MKKFEYLLEPRSIAIVGVSDDPGRPGSQAVRALMTYGYQGKIFPVNPKYQAFEELKCYPSVEAIDQAIDLVVIGVPAKGVIPVMEMCAAKSVSYVVVLSGGFRESGPEGVELERQMLEIARKAGIRVIGPNCLGFASIHSNVYAAFGSITREPRLVPGTVSLVTQSGGFGYSIALACAEAGVGFRHVIATGNESDVDTVELIDSLIDDELTTCIVAYIEGTRDGRALLDVGRRALAAGKPILLWKGGVTEQGARAAESHTASMTGTYDFYKALYKQTGIVEIMELHEVVDYVKAIAPGKYPLTNGVAVMGVSGGSAIVFADAGERSGLSLCELTEQTQLRLAPVVPTIGAIHNPIDLTAGYFSAANQDKLETAMRAVLDDANVGSLCVNIATTGPSGSEVAADVIGRVARDYDKPIVVFSSTPASANRAALDKFSNANIPVLPSPSRAARAISVLVSYNAIRQRQLDRMSALDTAPDTNLTDVPSIIKAGRGLSEAESKEVLAAAGVPVTKDLLLKPGEKLNLTGFTYPLVVKIVSRDIPHKSEIGGVKIGLKSPEGVEAAIKEVGENALRLAPSAHIDGVLISEMVTGGYELIAGVINDEVFGPVVMVGAGGIYAEILKDVTYRLAPFDDVVATEMLGELKCRPIFDGARGGAVLDVDAAARALAALSRFAWATREDIEEIDVNPLFLSTNGVIAADALVVPKSHRV